MTSDLRFPNRRYATDPDTTKVSTRQATRTRTAIPNQSRFIPLSRGQVAFIDSIDYELIAPYAWYAMPRTGSKGTQFYAAAKVGGKTIYMHRVIAGALPGEDVDHERNEATLDNRRHNLKRCTHAENMLRIRPGIARPNKTGFRGVHRRRGKYHAKIKITGKQIDLGARDSAIEAARLYDEHAIKTHGKWAITNFALPLPQTTSQHISTASTVLSPVLNF